MVILEYIARRNATEASLQPIAVPCETITQNPHIDAMFLSTIFIRDLFFLSLMTCNSIYILNILFKHHKTAQHVRSTTHSSQDSPEKKAARLILTLVTGFVFFYWINTFLTVYLFVIKNTSWQLEKFGNFIASCYPSICPFLLIKNENRIYRINYIKTRIRIFSS